MARVPGVVAMYASTPGAAPESVEAKIEAVKQLFLWFDLEVELRICTYTETDDDGHRDKSFCCEVFYEDDDWKEHRVNFVADANTEKFDGVLSASCISGTAACLADALDQLYRTCVEAMRRNYHVEVWTD